MLPVAVLFLSLGVRGTLAGNMPMCIQNTGGSCTSSSPCYDWRGSTRCDSLRCFCQDSFCSGTDGTCRSATEMPYVTLGGGQKYRIRNARFTDQYMYPRNPDGNVLTSTDTGDIASWTVVVPSSGKADPSVLLYPVRFPDSALQFAGSGAVKDTTVRCLKVDGALFGAGGDFPINQIATNIQIAPVPSPIANQTLFMLSSNLYTTLYAYVGQMSVGIGGSPVAPYVSDPGAGGYWYFEPPLPVDFVAKLRTYSGPRCNWLCGDVSSAPRRPGLAVFQWVVVVAAASIAIYPSAIM